MTTAGDQDPVRRAAPGGATLSPAGDVRPTETAVIVPVPDLEPVVDRHRRGLDVARTWGVPAHVSVLYPFAPPDAIDDRLVARLGEVLRSVPAFDCTFGRTEWFGEDVVWVAPEPGEPFRELTFAVWDAFPDFPPYGGAHGRDIVPHLTVGESRRGDLATLRAAEVAVQRDLPVRTRIDRAFLIEGTQEPGSWRLVRELPLG